MSINYLWQALRRRAWLILLTMLVGVAIVLWYTLAQPFTYRTEATLSISGTNPGTQPQSAVELAEALAPTLVAYMGTQTFANQVIFRTELSMTPRDLLNNVQTWHVPGTPLLRISAISQFPQQAERIVNGVAETLIAITAEQGDQIAASGNVLSATQIEHIQSARDELQYYTDLATDLKTRLAEYRSQPSSPSRDEGIASLSTELVQVQQTINDLRRWLIDVGSLTAGTSPYAISLVDPAPVPLVPESRPLTRNLLIGLSLSLIAGIVLALVPESLDYTVATPEELEETLGITALGAIAKIASQESEEDPIERLVARNYPRSPVAEAFRTLRTNIRFARPDLPSPTILITSAEPNEGKSLVAANLAVAIAQEERQAIIIDADLRRPSMHRFLGLSNRLGFTSLIMDSTLSIEDVIQDTDVPGLRAITSGPLPPNPLDMLASDRTARLFAKVKSMCDVLVLDAPPVLSVTDALLLATHADAALLVTAARATRRDLIVRAYETLKRSGVDIIGSVLNKVRQSDLGYYYSHYYYGYYYGSPSETPEEIPLVGRMQEPGEKIPVRK